MPVISTRRFSSTSSASSYSPNTIGTYRASSLTSDRYNSTGTTGKLSSTIQTTGSTGTDSYLNRSSYRTNLINTAYRTTSGLDDKRSTTPTATTTSTSRYGVSKYTKTSVDRDLPPSGSKYYNITQRLDNTNKRDNLNKIDNINTKNTNTKPSITPGLDLYEKYSPNNYIPKCELSRSRSLIVETSNKVLDKEKKDYSSSINGLTGTSIPIITTPKTTTTTVSSPTTNKVKLCNNITIINNNNNNNNNNINNNNLINKNNTINEKLLLTKDLITTKIIACNVSSSILNTTSTTVSSTIANKKSTTFNCNNLTVSNNNYNLDKKALSEEKIQQQTINNVIMSNNNNNIINNNNNNNSKNNNINSLNKINKKNLTILKYRDENFLKNEYEFIKKQLNNNNNLKINDNNNQIKLLTQQQQQQQQQQSSVYNNSTNNNIISSKIRINTLNNKRLIKKMNLYNNTLDDIKYIDSDIDQQQSQKQHHHQQQQKSTPENNLISNNQNLMINKFNNKLCDNNLIKDNINLFTLSTCVAGITETSTTATTTNNFISLTTTSPNTNKNNQYSSNFISINTATTTATTTNATKTTTTTTTNNQKNTNDFSIKSPYKNLINLNSNNNNNNINNSLNKKANEKALTINNKNCDIIIDKSVRNATTLRSGLPPTSAISSTSNRYWERDRERDHYRPVATSSDTYGLSRNTSLSSSTLGLDTATSSTSTPTSYNRSSSPVERIEGLCGLRNIGNTCFMNSVLQCLSHTNELTKYLKNYNTNTYARSSTKDQRILIEFVKLIKEMWQANQRSVTPLDLKQAFSSKYRIYSGCTQQDAQEFLRFFLDTLHTALNTGTKGEYLTIDDDLSDNNKADLTWNWYSKTENSVVKDLFVGQLKSSLRCTVCGNTSVTFDPFWDLSLPLPSSTRCKLETCLELFIKEEVMDGDEMPTCAKCKTRRKCTKTFTIQRFPRYLVIHLKRFSETRWSKLTNIVEFPTGERELNLAPYASNSSTSAVYTLYGISNHMGSTAGGHYVALCKHPETRRWHGFNDNTVSETSESGLVSSSAYLLFYERV